MPIKVTRIFDLPYSQLENYNLEKAFSTKYNGEWKSISSKEYIDKANTVSRGLLRLGIKPNDKIAVISTNNRTEWNICDIGILQTGAQNVPIYPTISKEDYEYILNHSEATYCFVSDKKVLDKLNLIKGNTKLKEVFTFDEVLGEKNWNEILELGKDESNQEEVEERKNNISPNDLATLIYTSGTTGQPKGVMLSHNNIISNILACAIRFPLEAGTRALSFLPVCHVFERVILYVYQYLGVSIYFAESIEKLSENAQETKPNIMTAVPRLCEKIYDKIIAKGADLPFIKRLIFFWAVRLGLKYEPYGANGKWYEKKLKIARKLVFHKWKEALGGEIDLMISGSASLQSRLVRVFSAAGLTVVEGYGLTETSPVVAANNEINRGIKIGTVGKLLDGIEVKFSEQNEILVKGPNVMLGYFKDPEKSAEAIKDGFFHTGDKGSIDEDGFLTITGRVKEMFKTSGGKYIIPNLIEDSLKKSRFIEQVMVVGEGEKMPTAFIQLNFQFIKGWCERHDLKSLSTNEEFINNPKVIARIQKEVDLCNSKFGNWEQIKKFTLTKEEWTVDSGHLTPTMKMRRNVIKNMYNLEYEKMYDRA
ncbi:MAG: long-chain fatty acid--CoA ligase [Tenacibaculum sp.]|nr:long-chain fatty acid--CoA ligase [Tenacibaculum sp.]